MKISRENSRTQKDPLPVKPRPHVQPRALVVGAVASRKRVKTVMVDAVYEVIGRSCEAGLTVVVIEQFVHRALALADQCVVLRRGEVSWSGRAAELDADDLGHYMG